MQDFSISGITGETQRANSLEKIDKDSTKLMCSLCLKLNRHLIDVKWQSAVICSTLVDNVLVPV